MTAPDHGFALMRRAAALAASYEASPFAEKYRPFVAEIRAAVPEVVAANYSGIGRYPVNADHDRGDPGWQGEAHGRRNREELARLALADRLGLVTNPFPDEEWLIDGPWLLRDVEAVRYVQSFLEQPQEFDLVEVALYPARTVTASMGFDVGYWASGNYSIVCDAVVWPLWHPPIAEALPRLREALAPLNSAVLFPDPESAARYRDVYRAEPWAEEEGTAFEIIEVARAAL